jgi:zinc protease
MRRASLCLLIPALVAAQRPRLGVTLVPFGASPKTLVRLALTMNDDCGWRTVVAHWFERAGRPFADSLAHMGGALTVTTRPSRIDLTVDVLSPFAPAAIAILAGVVRSRYPELQAAPDAPSSNLDSIAAATFQDALFPETQSGSCAAGPGRIGPYATRVIIVGRFETLLVQQAIAKAFEHWSIERTQIPRDAREPAGPSLTFVHQAGAKQVALVVGAPTPGPADSDFARVRVMNTVLGAGVFSRITRNIREAKGYAYAPASVLVTAPSGTTYWMETANVAANVAEPAWAEIIAEITRLGAAAPDTTEVSGAERYLAGRSLFELSTRLGQADAAELGTAPRDSLPSTGDDVRRVAHTYLAPQRLTIVVVGDTLALGPQLAAMRQAVSTFRAPE